MSDDLLAFVSLDRLSGNNEAARVIAEALLGDADADAVFVYVDSTLVVRRSGAVVRYRNGPAIRDALDRYARTGETPEPGTRFELEAPEGGAGS